jgi:ATP-dependent Clp protease adaptor protein ClpS
MEDTKTHKLVLYNDTVHSFHYVIACLIRFCGHEPIQAEQCALITHNVGKCSIKSGSFNEMFEIKSDLEQVDLKIEMEEYESSLY